MFQKLKTKFQNWRATRYGADQLGRAQLIAGLVLCILGLIVSAFKTRACVLIGSFFSWAGLFFYIRCIYRMLSSNTKREKRVEENRRYLALRERLATRTHQAKLRFQNRKQYKYFKCPNCKVLMRLPRGKGVVTVTCSRCHNSFTQKS